MGREVLNLHRYHGKARGAGSKLSQFKRWKGSMVQEVYSIEEGADDGEESSSW